MYITLLVLLQSVLPHLKSQRKIIIEVLSISMMPTFYTTCHVRHSMLLTSLTMSTTWHGTPSTLISDIVDHYAPIKSRLIKSKQVPYMNSRLRKALYIRNMARKKFKKFGKKYWVENIRQRNRVVSIRKQSMKNYFEKRCEKPDRNFWATISPFLSDRKFKGNNTITFKENNETITDQNKVAEIFDRYFVSIAAEIGFPDPKTSSDEALLTHQNHPSVIKIREKHPELHNSFSFHTVNPQEIIIHMKQLNIKKATGYDNIPGKIIRLTQRELSVPFANLINISLSQSVFPDAMKCAEVSPIFKKDDNMLKGTLDQSVY